MAGVADSGLCHAFPCQSCKDIGNLMDDQNAAAGCYLQAVFDKCPVSCVRVRGKMCFDGTPPVPRARSRNRIGR